MARIRHLLLTLLSGSAFYSGLVPALGLGEITLHSALNQPLDAQIELLEVGDLSADEIKVRLASVEDFNRAGVDRFYFLNDLRFTPVLGGGRNLIRVASSKAVREPYLNFIIEVARPGGSLLREYTVLIDPPGSAAFSPQASLVPQPREAAAPPVRPAAPPRAMPLASRGERYRVQPGDSLWSIAGRLQAGGSVSSREALMADLHALNPDAFSGGDRNRLRAEAELLLPDSALAAPVANDAPVEQSIGQPIEQPAAVAPLAAEQHQVDAELAGVTAQNQELRSAVDALQSQLAQLQAQMAEKDRQLQQIRDDLQRRQSTPAPVAIEPQPVAPPVSPPAPAPAERDWGWALWLGSALLILILLVGAWLLGRRRPVREPEPQSRPVVPEATPQARKVAAPPPEPVPEPQPRVETQIEDDEEVFQPAAVAAPPAQRLPASAADPLEGANIYIAYGRFADAGNVLRKALIQHPERLDLRLRLFEVYGELGDAAAFFEQERQLRELGASQVQVDQIRARYAALQRPQQDVPLADAVLQLDEPEPVVVAPDEFQLNLDDLSLDADWDLVSPFRPEQSGRARAAQEQAPDPHFRSNLQELPEVLEMEVLESFAELPQEQVLDTDLAPEPTEKSQGPLHSDLDHLAGDREHLVKLNLALAYIEQGDIGSACDILNEVISEGDEEERERARELLAKIA
ncbi:MULTISPECIES: FimV/HubP family polar landmark protein [unclassified Pseudomonas]|uniref:FimV/HubP family polar landmark protein n=1 Tax=unclassified Pseudomonas TaxID=196821 RepID=UPI00244CB3DD|nr:MULTISPECIES: FimV/HubP family polar landmark protein [unclassified Pseudomonas]MDG9925413.1 peptidoglycan-binding protein LysM [Pseudomonas sp. GD04045]MDH0037247.1 peptidoglycan-binding protein LysM [Pseudomonas sp. GD04019]